MQHGNCGVITVDHMQATATFGARYEFKVSWQILCALNSAGPFTNRINRVAPLTPASLTLPAGGIGAVWANLRLNMGANVITFRTDDPDAVAELNEGNNVCTVTIVVI